MVDDDDKLGLRERPACMKHSNDLPSLGTGGILDPVYTETNFTSIDQRVQKTTIDMFGTLTDQSEQKMGMHFVGALKQFNILLSETDWKNKKTSLLDLPKA